LEAELKSANDKLATSKSDRVLKEQGEIKTDLESKIAKLTKNDNALKEQITDFNTKKQNDADGAYNAVFAELDTKRLRVSE
jgi:cell division protein FtsB